MYQFQASSELMKNQKAAQVLSNSSQLDALQTSDGQALFFSIGDGNILYLYAEQQGVSTGWTVIDLTADLQALYSSTTFKAKSFSVSQDPTSGDIIIAQVITTADNQDHLCILPGLSYLPDSSWLQPGGARSWVAREYDDTQNPESTLSLHYAQLTSNQITGNTPYLVAGVVQSNQSYIQNYLVSTDPTATTSIWQRYTTPTNFQQSLGLQVGMTADTAPGLYQLFTNQDDQNTQSLEFTYSLGGPAMVTVFTPPAGASAIATSPDSNGNTNLYIAGQSAATPGEWAIYLLTADQQDANDPATDPATEIITSPLIKGVDFLEVHLAGSQMTLWGRNDQGTLFYSRWSGVSSDSWSAPVAIQEGALEVASLLNLQTMADSQGYSVPLGSVLFVNTDTQSLVYPPPTPSVPLPPPATRFIKLTQDPVTTQWQSQTLLLPSLSVDDVVEFYSYTTHIDVVDENSQPLPNQSFTLIATSPVSVYVNDVYIALSTSPDNPTTVWSTGTGSVTIVQETQTLGAVAYILTQEDGTAFSINPMSGVISRLGNSLPLTVTDETDNASDLFPPTVTGPQQGLVANAINQLYSITQSMPSTGVSLTSPISLNDTQFGLSFAGGDVTSVVASFEGAVEGLAGDIFHWAHQVIDDVEQFVVNVESGVVHFYMTVAGSVYHFVLTCVSDVLHGVHFLFAKLGVAFETLVQWLGYIFNWNDIIATHAVIKNVITQFLAAQQAELSTLSKIVSNVSDNLQQKLGTFSDLPGTPTDSAISVVGPQPSTSHPAAHWPIHQLRSNVGGAGTSYTPPDLTTAGDGGTSLTQILQGLSSAVQAESNDIFTAVTRCRTVLDNIHTLTIEQIITQLGVVLAEVITSTITDAITAAIKLIQELASILIDAFKATIDIPVLSWIYKKYAKDDFSFMDLACLAAAVPSTVIFKIIKTSAPYAANDPLSTATNFQQIQTLLAPPVAPPDTMERQDAVIPVYLDSPLDVWNFVSNITASFSAAAVWIFAGLKLPQVSPTTSPVVGIGYAASYVPYCAPDFGVLFNPNWIGISNEQITFVSIVKNLIDLTMCKFDGPASTGLTDFLAAWGPVSPAVDAGISLAWMVPTVGALVADHSPSGAVSFVGNVSFNATALFVFVNSLYFSAPPLLVDPYMASQTALASLAEGSIAFYGASMLTCAFVGASKKNHW